MILLKNKKILCFIRKKRG